MWQISSPSQGGLRTEGKNLLTAPGTPLALAELQTGVSSLAVSPEHLGPCSEEQMPRAPCGGVALPLREPGPARPGFCASIPHVPTAAFLVLGTEQRKPRGRALRVPRQRLVGTIHTVCFLKLISFV